MPSGNSDNIGNTGKKKELAFRLTDVNDIDVVKDFEEWRLAQGLPPRKTGYKKKIYSVSLSPEAYQGLKTLARIYKALHGSNPSVSEFIEQIGLFKLAVINPKKGTKDEPNAQG